MFHSKISQITVYNRMQAPADLNTDKLKDKVIIYQGCTKLQKNNKKIKRTIEGDKNSSVINLL